MSLVDQHQGFAQSILQAGQQSGTLPRNFSGMLSPRMGNFIMMLQYDKDYLVGCVAVHINNAKRVSKQIAAGIEQPDLFTYMKEGEDDESDDGDPTSSGG